MIPIWIGEVLLGLTIGVVALFIILQTPLVEIINLLTMPFGYRIESCPYCPDVGLQKREYGTCVTCGERFSYYGYSNASIQHLDGNKIEFQFCSIDCHKRWKDAGEPLDDITLERAEVVPA